MKAFIYARYSAGPSQKELSIEGQLRECHDYAAGQGIDILGEYADRKISGRTDNRSEFRRLLRDCQRGVVDMVLVWKLDRFFRNRAESALYRKQLAEYGVKLVSVREPVPEGSAGIITSGMLETLAEWYSAQLAENVTRGMYDTARKGLNTGPYPLGYKVGADKRLHIDPPAAELVQRIFEAYDQGLSMRTIADQLNQEGHKTRSGKPFCVNSFDTILRNEKYIGVVKYGNQVILKGGCPRIIEDDLFFRVQRKLSLNKKRPGANKAAVTYYLSGKIFCGRCGTVMVGTCGTSRNKARHYYYTCDLRHRRRECKKKNVSKELIEAKVLDAAIGILTDEMIAYLAAEVEKRCATMSGAADLISSLTNQLAETEKRLKNIGNAIAAGIITETTKTLLEDAEADRAALRHQIEIAKAQAQLVISAEQVACWLDGFRKGNKNDPQFKKEIFGALVHRVYVYDDKIKIIFNSEKNAAIDLSLEEISSAEPECSYLVGSGQPKATDLVQGLSLFILSTTQKSLPFSLFAARMCAILVL